jgi:hypothetical protein
MKSPVSSSEWFFSSICCVVSHIGGRINIKGGRMVLIESLGAPKIILGGLGLYKPNAPGLVLDAPIL